MGLSFLPNWKNSMRTVVENILDDFVLVPAKHRTALHQMGAEQHA